MRSVLAVLAACGGTAAPIAPPVAVTGPPTCDMASVVASTKRAWLAGTDHAVVVADMRGGEVQIASVTRETVVTRWVNTSQLDRAVSVETAVSHTPGGAPDPNLFVLPGFHVRATTAAWAFIASAAPMPFAGYVPSSATTIVFEAPPERHEPMLQLVFPVHTDPRSDSPVRVTLQPGARVRVDHAATPPWFAITAWGEHVRVTGFIEPPVAMPEGVPMHDGSERVDFAEEWLPVGTCLREAPHGRIVGQIVGPLSTEPRAHRGGGTEVRVSTPWGAAAYYADEVITRTPEGEPFDWKF